MSQYITLKEAARISGYHQDYLGQLIRSGKLSGRRLGKEWVTTALVLAEYMNGKSKTPASLEALTLPGWRRHLKKLVILSFVVAVLFGIIFAPQLQEFTTAFVAGEGEGGVSRNSEKIVIGGEGPASQELVITSYAVDDAGNIEVGVAAPRKP